jgi:hypothetical protein
MHHRKRWDRAFSSPALKEYEIMVAKRSRQLVGSLEDLIHGLRQKEGVVLNVAAWMSYYT